MSAPTPFGKYQLIDRISIGGMAEVFRAKIMADRSERLFAIKKILPSLCEDANFIKMFVEEARLAGQLVHPNICAIHELGRADGAHFLAMEYIWGKDLIQVRTKLRKAKQKVPLAICVYILAGVLEGLDYAHKKRDPLGRMLGLVHRDLSPHNVLLSYDGEVKVIDFGIAKADSRASMTQAGTLKGKFAYMSPEQVHGGKLDRRSDIFALGTLFFELVTGERLFFGESDFNTLERVRKVEVKPPREIDPTIPEGVEKVIYKALAKEVDNRYQWCNEMRADLEPFLTVDQTVVAAWMHQVFAAEIPVEREQIEFGLAAGRARPAQAAQAETPPIAIPAPASLPARRPVGKPVVEDQRSKSGGSKPKQANVHVEDNRSKSGGSIRAASAVHVEDNRSRPGGFRPAPPSPSIAPPVADREGSNPKEGSKPRAPMDTQPSPPLKRPSAPMEAVAPPKRTSAPMEAVQPKRTPSTPMDAVTPPKRISSPMDSVPPPMRGAPINDTIPPPTRPSAPILPEAGGPARIPRRTKAPSIGDFTDEPATQSSAPSFGPGDWSEPQQPMDWSESLELSEAGTPIPRAKWPESPAQTDPIVPTQTSRERPSKWTQKTATEEQPWTDQWNDETAHNTPLPGMLSEPVVEALEPPPDPTLDLLDLSFDTLPAETELAPPEEDDFLDLKVEVAPPDDEDPPPEPAPEPTNRVLRLGGGRFRPNKNR